jgi:hypothetical protein
MKKATSIIVFKNIKEKLQIYMIKRSGKSRFMAGGKNKKRFNSKRMYFQEVKKKH